MTTPSKLDSPLAAFLAAKRLTPAAFRALCFEKHGWVVSPAVLYRWLRGQTPRPSVRALIALATEGSVPASAWDGTSKKTRRRPNSLHPQTGEAA
jgi:hypothetical protein